MEPSDQVALRRSAFRSLASSTPTKRWCEARGHCDQLVALQAFGAVSEFALPLKTSKPLSDKNGYLHAAFAHQVAISRPHVNPSPLHSARRTEPESVVAELPQ